MSQGEISKSKGQKNKKRIRYGLMGFLGWFEHNENEIPKTRTHAVIKTRRGLEIGEVVGPFCYRGGQFKTGCREVEKYFGDKPGEYPLVGNGTFVRFATAEDMMEAKHLKASAKKEVKCCEKFAREAKLPMKIIDGEHLLGGERVVIYFTSEGRVDFRDLVKRLAKEFQTRIELRQVGSRDEARLISDYESCGQECCCRRYLKVLEPVNMRMAKLQKATLDPSKISGHCGRLKCCLRYEDFTYRELNKRLPKKNTRVKIPKGEGRVIDTQILTQLVVVLDDTGNIEAFALEDIEIIAQGSEDKKDNTKNNNNSSNKPTGRQTNTKSGQKTNHKGKQNNNNKSNDDKNVNQH